MFRKYYVIFIILFMGVSSYAADTKLSDLTELATTPADSDEIYINDGGTSKKIQYSNLVGQFIESAAVIGDNTVLRGDGGARGVQDSDWLISDVGNFYISTDYAGFLGVFVTNTNSDVVNIAGPIVRLTNNGPYYGSISMASTTSTFGSSAFQSAFHIYNQGYGDSLYTVDGAKDHVWYADPTDSHDYSALSNEVMRLTSAGNLTVGSGVVNAGIALCLDEQSSPASNASNKIRLYAYDSGGNETSDTTVLLHFDTVGSGNPTNDATGAGTITTTNSGTTQQASVSKFLPAALQLDSATTEYVDINNMWATDTGGWSIDTWAYSKNITSDRPILCAGDGTNNNWLSLRVQNNGQAYFRLRTAGTNRITLTSSNGDVPINAWVHYRVERTDDTYYLYVNGEFVDSALNSNDPVSLNDWNIGANLPRGDTDYFDGYIDEFKIYMDQDENFNSSDFSPPSAPYDSPTLWYVDENGNRVSLVNVAEGTGAGSYWHKLADDTLAYEVGGLNRYLIPPQGADNATNGMRSFIVDGTYQDVGDESDAYSCAANGFDRLDCDTGGTGADLGVQDDAQIKGKVYVDESVYIEEQADAFADIAGYGQIWVNTATPNELWFTDDAGTDVQLGVSGSGDIASVGDCTDGACYDGSSDGGTYARIYDGNSNYMQLDVEDISANYTLSLPSTIGTSGQLMQSDGDNTTSWTSTLNLAFSGSTPEWLMRDTDAAGAAATDEDAGSGKANMSTTTEDGEVSDNWFTTFGSATAGTEYAYSFWDSSDAAWIMGVMTDASTPAAVSGYEALKWDFNTGTDNEVAVSVGVSSGADTINFIGIELQDDGVPIGAETNSLETVCTNIATTEIPIGTSADTATYAALSGDVTMANDGVVTIANDAVETAMINTDAVTMDGIDADGNFTSLTGNWTTTGNWTGNFVLDDEDSLEIMADADGMDDDEFNGVTVTGRACGEGLTQWDLVRIADDADPWHQADADAAGEFPAFGITVAACTDTNEAKILTQGMVRNEGWTGLTVGGAVYLSATVGGITQTAPSTSGDCVQIVGWAMSDSEIYFDFSRPYQEVE